MKTVKINNEECVIITKSAITDLVHKLAHNMRQRDKIGLSSLNDCLEILNCSKKTFYKYLKDPKTYIKKSRHGMYVTSSIERERDRKK